MVADTAPLGPIAAAETSRAAAATKTRLLMTAGSAMVEGRSRMPRKCADRGATIGGIGLVRRSRAAHDGAAATPRGAAGATVAGTGSAIGRDSRLFDG
jgi:hypothetical protein